MKKLSVLIISLFLLLTMAGTSFAESNEISVGQAKQAATFHLNGDINVDANSGWSKESSISEPIKLYDLNDILVAYLFKIKTNGEDNGYIVVSATKDKGPIMAYSYDGRFVDDDILLREAQKKLKSGQKVNKITPVYLGPVSFAIKYDMIESNGNKSSVLINSRNKQKLEQSIEVNKEKQERTKEDKEKSSKQWDYVGGSSIPSSGRATNPDSYESGYSSKVTKNVANVSFFTNGIDQPDVNFCAPTAMQNLLWYHANNNYSSYGVLFQGMTRDEVTLMLGDNMNTNVGKQGTAIGDIIPGAEEFTDTYRNKNFSYDYDYVVYWGWDLENEIVANRPVFVSLFGQNYYGNHAVTVGGTVEYSYTNPTSTSRWMRIHNNWYDGSSGVDYVHFDDHYTDIDVINVTPG